MSTEKPLSNRPRWTRFESDFESAGGTPVIRLLFAAAVALFVLSLPTGATALGASLRRWAGVCFAAALLPSVIVGFFFPDGAASLAEHPIAMTFGLLIAIRVAYIAYELRKWLHADPSRSRCACRRRRRSSARGGSRISSPSSRTTSLRRDCGHETRGHRNRSLSIQRECEPRPTRAHSNFILL